MKPAVRPIPSFLLPFTTLPVQTKARGLHQISDRRRASRPPPTIPFVPDVKTFLTLIGRSLSKHSDKIKSWSELFTLTSGQLKGMGIEPPRSRRYLLRWREKYRKGLYGIGGDLKHVKQGAAQLRVAELPVVANSSQINIPMKKRKIVVNVAAGSPTTVEPTQDLVPVKGLHVKGDHTIVGKAVLPLKGNVGAQIVVSEGLWEDRRGTKTDGGERRRVRIFPAWYTVLLIGQWMSIAPLSTRRIAHVKDPSLGSIFHKLYTC